MYVEYNYDNNIIQLMIENPIIKMERKNELFCISIKQPSYLGKLKKFLNFGKIETFKTINFFYENFENKKSKKYIFGKLQICFQVNNDYGGNIDVLSEHYIKGLNRTPLKIKIFLKLQDLLVKNKYLRKKYFKNTWISDVFAHLMRFEKVITKPISVIIFEHRLFHRGTPMKPNIFFSLH